MSVENDDTLASLPILIPLPLRIDSSSSSQFGSSSSTETLLGTSPSTSPVLKSILKKTWIDRDLCSPEKQSLILQCVCGMVVKDVTKHDQRTICCNICKKWQHVKCNNVRKMWKRKVFVCRECQSKPSTIDSLCSSEDEDHNNNNNNNNNDNHYQDDGGDGGDDSNIVHESTIVRMVQKELKRKKKTVSFNDNIMVKEYKSDKSLCCGNSPSPTSLRRKKNANQHNNHHNSHHNNSNKKNKNKQNKNKKKK